MSRETLKSKVLEVTKKREKNQLIYVVNYIQELAISDSKEDVIYLEDIMCHYAAIVELRRFLEDENYNPFLFYYETYAPGTIPTYPEGKTFWEINDTDIEIIEEDPESFAMDVVDFIQSTSINHIKQALQPYIIKNEYISMIQRCIHKEKKQKE